MAKIQLKDVAHEYKCSVKDNHGLKIVGLEHLDSGKIDLCRWDERRDCTFTKTFKKGHILFGRRRAYLKKAAIAPFGGVCSGDIIVIEADPDKILPELLPFIIQNEKFFDYAVSKSAGSLSPRVKWVDLKEYSFELPDLEQQANLVNILKAAYETKKAYENLENLSDDIIQARYIEMFGDFSLNPKHIPVTNIGALFDVGSSKRVLQKDWKDEGVPFYRAREIIKLSEQGFVNNELFISNEMYNEYSKKYGVPVAGDIMITGVGTLGICYLVKATDKFYYKDGNTICLHKKQNVNSRFILESYKMPYIRTQIEDNAIGATVGTYTIDRARKTLVFNPNIEEQDAFVEFVEHVDLCRQELQKAIARIDNFVGSLLN